ncbi:MAG: EamA/RhaT family transporter [Burkholderiales bacterium]|jgi:drug/metabolite transporter (DMT)-like permease|nr:EamA/RhaT family transporter [Burkholderiales bacterium]
MNKFLGLTCALLAAIFNAMIGIFSVKLISYGMQPFEIAFYKCLIALIMISTYLVVTGKFIAWVNYLKRNYIKIAICALFGFFVLYFFETNAYNYSKVPVVVFLLLGSSTITTFVLSVILNKKKLHRREIITCIIAILGLGFVFNAGENIQHADLLGIVFALLAGIGYGTFLTLGPIFRIGSGLVVVNSLMLFGTAYLSIPIILHVKIFVPNLHQLSLLLGLALLPTIGGFWCTVKALTLLESKTVQLIELTEPVISLVSAFIFLSQALGYRQLLGGTLVLCAIYINAMK